MSDDKPIRKSPISQSSKKNLGPMLKTGKPKVKKLKDMTLDELKVELQQGIAQQFKLRMQKASGQFKQNHIFKVVRRHVARVKYFMHMNSKKEKEGSIS